MLTWQFWHCRQDVEALQPFLKLKDVNTIEAHPMQYLVWWWSPKARMFIDFVVTIAFATWVHLLVSSIMDRIEYM